MLTFKLGQPISKEKLETIVQKFYKRPLSELHVVYDAENDEGEKRNYETLGIAQTIKPNYLYTVLTAFDGPTPKEAARIIATEGGVDVLFFDRSQGSWIEGWDGTTLGPFMLVKPDGSMHRARRRKTPPGLPYGKRIPWKDGLYLLD